MFPLRYEARVTTATQAGCFDCGAGGTLAGKLTAEVLTYQTPAEVHFASVNR